MRRLYLRLLIPSLGLAVCAIVASLMVAHAGDSRSMVFGAALMLALAVLAADISRSRLRGRPSRPSAAALIMAGAVILAGLMVGMDDPRHVQAFMPALCAVAVPAKLRDRRCLPSSR